MTDASHAENPIQYGSGVSPAAETKNPIPGAPVVEMWGKSLQAEPTNRELIGQHNLLQHVPKDIAIAYELFARSDVIEVIPQADGRPEIGIDKKRLNEIAKTFESERPSKFRQVCDHLKHLPEKFRRNSVVNMSTLEKKFGMSAKEFADQLSVAGKEIINQIDDLGLFPQGMPLAVRQAVRAENILIGADRYDGNGGGIYSGFGEGYVEAELGEITVYQTGLIHFRDGILQSAKSANIDLTPKQALDIAIRQVLSHEIGHLVHHQMMLDNGGNDPLFVKAQQTMHKKFRKIPKELQKDAHHEYVARAIEQEITTNYLESLNIPAEKFDDFTYQLFDFWFTDTVWDELVTTAAAKGVSVDSVAEIINVVDDYLRPLKAKHPFADRMDNYKIALLYEMAPYTIDELKSLIPANLPQNEFV